MQVGEINPDWLMFEIAKLNSRSFVNLSKAAIQELITQSEDRLKQLIAAKTHDLDIKNIYQAIAGLEVALQKMARRFDMQIECNDMLAKKIETLEKQMTKLTTKARKALPKKAFALPKEEKYPINDKAHAANAKARATQQVKKGKLSASAKEKIDAKANKVLKKGKK